MKRFIPLIAFTLLLSVITLPLWSATSASTGSAADRSPAGGVATAITAVTGIAISPLLGTGAYGAYQYFQTPAEHRAELPWFAQMSFWLPALAIVGACAAKDAAGAALPPGWKKPLDVLETIENQATGLVAAGAVVPFTMAAMSKMILGSGEAAAAAGETLNLGGVGMIHLAAIDWSWLLNIITVPCGIAIFAVVWMGSHAINGLILLSPWGAIDAALKGARTSLLGLLVIANQFDPWVSAGISIVVIIFAYFIAGWSFRLSVFSSVFCWDYFTMRKGRYKVQFNDNKVFAGTGLGTAPQRTYGRLHRTEDGTLQFTYKPWLVLPEKRVEVPPAQQLAVGCGAFFCNVTDGRAEVFVLPPRYRSHEEELAEAYHLGLGVTPIGFNKAWSWLRGAVGGKPVATPV
ncbi:hypothetical protein [Synoicihabitans lomoniglobus]|uniref:Uncharacterized protein n=1 Tax=Synoicihabitans lomoniglobus TaxID=2909285 RepID=A0AAE9ZZZ5_9BACT|nr:hypothetical protein [Opitutaceae bacterium LMO-M01]WED64648.1 hypothetical protein PXH66_20080 [Opitutaceae bacterium LMO-M01]